MEKTISFFLPSGYSSCTADVPWAHCIMLVSAAKPAPCTTWRAAQPLQFVCATLVCAVWCLQLVGIPLLLAAMTRFERGVLVEVDDDSKLMSRSAAIKMTFKLLSEFHTAAARFFIKLTPPV